MGRPVRRGLSAEMSSIIVSLSVSILAFIYFKYFPGYMPQHDWVRGLPGWLALGYVTVQLWMLLDSALRVRPTGVIGAVLAIAPVVTGIVCGVLWIVGYLNLSLFQVNALAMLIAAGVVGFVSTLWVRHVVLQRGVAMIPGQDSE